MGSEQSVENSLFGLKYTSKQLARESQKLEKQEKVERRKIKEAIEKGSWENAKIYAENAIRNKNQAVHFLRLSSRVEAVASRVESAVRMQQVSVSMQGVVQGMDAALKSMDLVQISRLMDAFDSTFEDLDVRSSVMEDAMVSSQASSMSVEQVDDLIGQVAAEHGIEIGSNLTSTPVSPNENDQLAARLESLQKL
jgi:charged multivesicular body protein 1